VSFARWLERHAAATPDQVALRFEGGAWSYAELSARVDRLAAGLARELGLGRGDRIAWLGLNHPDLLALLFACARLGALLVPLNWRLAAPELCTILADAEPKALIAEVGFRAPVEEIRASLPGCRLIACDFMEVGWTPLAELLKHPDVADVAGTPDDAVLIVYTSGTTGRPKGAVLSQSALLWNALNSAHMHDLTSADHVLTVLPLFHVGGLNIQTLPALHAGASVTLARRFEPAATLAAIAASRPSLTVLVPAAMRAMIDHPAWPGADLSSLRMVTTGSQIVPRDVIEPFHRRGVPVAQVYGTTESGPVAVYQRRADALRAPGAAGRPALHGELRIVDDAGADLAANAHGEVLLRGPHLMSCYWRDPAASAAVLQDGWFRTGDVGHLGRNGELWIDARKDDLIKSGGERIYPAELEDLLRRAPGVADVAIVGRPDPRWGEVPVAVVVASGTSPPRLGDLIARLEGRVARFKHPKDVLVVDELPRSALGKVLRYRLRALACGGN
jgi:fatty-acyl-CoA synthase